MVNKKEETLKQVDEDIQNSYGEILSSWEFPYLTK